MARRLVVVTLHDNLCRQVGHKLAGPPAKGDELVHFAGAAWHPTVGRMEKTLTLPSPTQTRARVPEGRVDLSGARRLFVRRCWQEMHSMHHEELEH